MDKRCFSEKIVEWYHENKRGLPWRDTKDPYYIWLSEIILQQTRVNQGLPYYLRFIEKYPNVHLLAAAAEDEVLRLWQGLGYYSRARNLHKCAKTVVELHSGVFPKDYKELLSLPGVGEYTAAAIASFAFREPVAVVDGNVFRVLSRVFGIDTPINSPQGKNEFRQLANELIDHKAPDLHNQALMEFGATCCTPVAPDCAHCVLQDRCFAFAKSLQGVLPVKTKSKPSKNRYFYYLVFQQGDSLLMKKRTGKDIWLGLYDFPLLEYRKPVTGKLLTQDLEKAGYKLSSANTITMSDTYKHVLTHQNIFCKFVLLKPRGKTKLGKPETQFYTFSQISALPKPILINRFLIDFSFHA